METLITYCVGAGAFVVGVVIAIVSKVKANKKKKNGKINPLKTFDTDLRIQESITELRVELGAQRVYIAKFHNGGEYFDGGAIKKISRTHESCERSVSHEFINYQNVPVTLVPDVMSLLKKSWQADEVVCGKVEDLFDGFLKHHMKRAGVHLFLKYRIVSDGRLTGYLGVQYNIDAHGKFGCCKQDKNVCTLPDEILEKIKTTAGDIENLFVTGL